MNIWRISGNSNYKSCILDNNDKQIYDPAFYFKERQEDLSFKRTIPLKWKKIRTCRFFYNLT